ncbi:MAG: glycosyltransferase [Actinomycetota bacterium]
MKRVPEFTPFLSVVMAECDPGDELAPYLRALSAELEGRFPDHEIVVVDNASSDGTADRLRSLVLDIPNLQCFFIARHVKDDTALTAGLDQCIGDVVVTIEAGVDPPEAVVRAADIVAGGTDIVYGKDETNRPKSRILYPVLGRIWGWAFRRSSRAELPQGVFAMRAVSRRVFNTWMGIADRDRLLRVLPALSGFPYTEMPYEALRSSSRRGKSLLGSLRTGAGTILSSSAAPLRVAYVLGLLGAFVNLVFAIYILVVALLVEEVVPGWISLAAPVAFLAVVFSIILAILAEYVFQIAMQSKGWPLYRISDELTSPAATFRERLNVSEEKKDEHPSLGDDAGPALGAKQEHE